MAETTLTRSLRPRFRPSEEKKLTFVDFVLAEKTDRLSQYAALGMTAAQIKVAADNFDKDRTSEMLQVLVDEGMGSKASITIGHIRGFQFSKNRQQIARRDSPALYNAITYLHSQGMPYSDIANELAKRRTARLQAVEADHNFNTKRVQKLEREQEARAITAMVKGDRESFTNILKTLTKLNPLKAAELEEKFAAAGELRTVSDPESLRFLNRQFLKGVLSFGDLGNNFDKLSLQDQEDYTNKIETLESDELKLALDIIFGEMRLPANYEELSEEDPNYNKAQLFKINKGRLTREMALARRGGINFDALATAKELIATMETEAAKLTRNALIQSARKQIIQYNTLLSSSNLEPIEVNNFPGAISYFEEQLVLLRGDRNYKVPGLVGKASRQITTLENYILTLEKALPDE